MGAVAFGWVVEEYPVDSEVSELGIFVGEAPDQVSDGRLEIVEVLHIGCGRRDLSNHGDP
jgi:hypothetical protein